MDRLYLLAIVASTIVISAADLSSGICPSGLGPNEVAFIAHETDCTLYYRCIGTNRHLETCPTQASVKLCFDDQLNICSWGANVLCCNPFLTTSETPTTDDGNPGYCPATGKRPHRNCLKYYDSNGNEQCCRENHAFNRKLCQCDLQSNVLSCQPTDSEKAECSRFIDDN
ncbi:uncharacterized protein LOC144467572 [Augochlora pura]